MKHTLHLAVAALLLGLFAAACSDNPAPAPTSGPSPAATGSAAPSASASTTPGAEPTATREAAPPLPPVVARMLADVAGIRGLPVPDGLRMSVISRAELPDLLDSLITQDDRDLLARTTTLYRLMGHFRDDQDYLSLYTSFGATGILGLYSPLDDELWVVNDSGASGLDDLSRSEKETLAHELVHALQDAQFRLDEKFQAVADDADRSLALTVIVEGDAVVHEELYGDEFIALPLAAGRLWLLGVPPAQAGDIPLSFIRELLFPYTAGAEWVRSVRAAGGTAAVDAYLENPPAATAIVLHPELGREGWQPQVVALPNLAPVLGPGWDRESGGTLGEFNWRNYLQLGTSGGRAADAAAGWQGDAYAVYVRDEHSAAVFRVQFADSDEATEFARQNEVMLEARASRPPSREGDFTIHEIAANRYAVTRPADGDDVLFVIATDRATALALAEAIVPD